MCSNSEGQVKILAQCLASFVEKLHGRYNSSLAKVDTNYEGPKAQQWCSENESFYFIGGTLTL